LTSRQQLEQTKYEINCTHIRESFSKYFQCTFTLSSKNTNRSVKAAEVIEELLELARKVREEKNRAKQQNITEDEIAFYDALGANDSTVKVLGDETLRNCS